MSDYIPTSMPTTEEIREYYAKEFTIVDGKILRACAPGNPDDLAEFDRWLKQVKAEAWREGFDAGERDVWEHEHSEDGWDADCIPNPYLEGEK